MRYQKPAEAVVELRVSSTFLYFLFRTFFFSIANPDLSVFLMMAINVENATGETSLLQVAFSLWLCDFLASKIFCQIFDLLSQIVEYPCPLSTHFI